jgi:hypothetical protein
MPVACFSICASAGAQEIVVEGRQGVEKLIEEKRGREEH